MIEEHPDRFNLEVVIFASVDKLVRVIERFDPEHVILTDLSQEKALMERLPKQFRGSLAFGENSFIEAANAPAM